MHHTASAAKPQLLSRLSHLLTQKRLRGQQKSQRLLQQTLVQRHRPEMATQTQAVEEISTRSERYLKTHQSMLEIKLPERSFGPAPVVPRWH